MADRGRDGDRDRPSHQQTHLHSQSQFQPPLNVKFQLQQKGQWGQGPTTSQILLIITLVVVPICGTLLGLSGITLIGTLIGLAVATPLFLIFSPILVPAAILIAGTVTAFITSGAFGVSGLTSISWVLNSFKTQYQYQDLDLLEDAKHHAQDAGIYLGEKTKQAGEIIKSKAQEGGDTANVTAGGRTRGQ